MRSTSKKLFWVVAIVVILVLALMAVPSFIKSRNVSSKYACMNNLLMIDAGKEEVALAKNWNDETDCDNPTNKALINQYIKGNTTPICPDGGRYSYNLMRDDPTCSKYRADDPSTRLHLDPNL